MKQFMLPEEPTFAYCTPTKPETCVNAIHDLEEYLEVEGPYDGIIGFSLGANFALSWMINKIQKNGNRGQLPFKVGIFFSTADRLLECKETPEKFVAPWNPVEIDGIIDIPTAHIWGTADSHRANSQLASLACDEDNRSIFVHDRGHEVPISAENVISAAKAINRAITRAQGFN
ncbi:unnamed protein product [Penicillium salamii]|nr:unnamed protein product [Penicillium salamii]